MSMVETRFYNIIWYVSEDKSEAETANEIGHLLPKMNKFPHIWPDTFVLTGIRQERCDTVIVKGVVNTASGPKNVIINVHVRKESDVPAWAVLNYKSRNISDFAALLRRITCKLSRDTGAVEGAKTSSSGGATITMGGDSVPLKAVYEWGRAIPLDAVKPLSDTELQGWLRRICKDRLNLKGLKVMIRSITVNEKKKVTTVVFKDGDVQMAKCSKNDEYDKVVGISICIAAHLAGSKEKLKKFVKEMTE